MKKLNTLLLLILVASSTLFAQNKTDLSGTWILDVQTDMGSGSPTFVLKQDTEGKITGSYAGQLGETQLTGSIKDNVFHVEFSVQNNLVKYDGMVENEIMSGKLEIGTAASGTFTGKRKEK